MPDLKRFSRVLTNYSVVVLVGAIVSLFSPITLPVSFNAVHLIVGGLPLAILYLIFRAYRNETEIAKYEIPLLLTPIILSPLLGIIIAIVMSVADRF